MRRAILLIVGLLVGAGASAAPVVRTLEVKLTVDGTQDWVRNPGSSKATTQQRYDVAVQLRSDGRLYADNLLDPDPQKRVQIKMDWYLYQGLSELKAENGGKLPAPGGQPVLSAESMMQGGMMSPAMSNMSPQRVNALQALSENSAAELEEFLRRYDQPGGRWMYFEGFAGCTNRLSLELHSKWTGDNARKPGNRVPFEMQWDGVSTGTPEQQQSLCRRYVASYEPASDTLYVENVYLPATRGTSVRTEYGRVEKSERELPPPNEVMVWVDAALKKSRGAGKQTATVPLTGSLDGNDTVLGSFKGSARLSLEWALR